MTTRTGWCLTAMTDIDQHLSCPGETRSTQPKRIYPCPCSCHGTNTPEGTFHAYSG